MHFVSCIFLFRSVCVEDPFSDAHNSTLDVSHKLTTKTLVRLFKSPIFSYVGFYCCTCSSLPSICCKFKKTVHKRDFGFRDVQIIVEVLRFLTSFIGMISKRMGGFWTGNYCLLLSCPPFQLLSFTCNFVKEVCQVQPRQVIIS